MSHEWERLTSNGLGVRLEVAPMHPGFAALAIPWRSGVDHKRWLSQLAYLGNIIVLLRDQGEGRVIPTEQGSRVRYRLTRGDWRRLGIGVGQAARIHAAAGAEAIRATNDSEWSRDTTTTIESFARRVQRQIARRSSTPLYSAHQMATCRMASDSRRGACGLDGSVYGVTGLSVADASLLPGACGVNPMLTIMALAHRVAHALSRG